MEGIIFMNTLDFIFIHRLRVLTLKIRSCTILDMMKRKGNSPRFEREFTKAKRFTCAAKATWLKGRTRCSLRNDWTIASTNWWRIGRIESVWRFERIGGSSFIKGTSSRWISSKISTCVFSAWRIVQRSMRTWKSFRSSCKSTPT